MAKKIDYKALLKKFSYTRDRDPMKVPLRPYRDWGVLFACFSAFFAAAAIANAYLFIEINKEEIFSKELAPGEEIEMLDLKALGSAIEFFDGRAAAFEALRAQKPDIVDPAR